jgi:hypothetical protein
MKNFLTFIFIFFSCVTSATANFKNGEGFYVGVDPSKTNDKIGKVDNSVSPDSKIAEDRYYGYKFSGGGLFVSPEIFMQSGQASSYTQTSSSNATTSGSVAKPDQLNVVPNVGYNVKANVGYDFNRYVSGFVTYDLGTFSYNPGQKSVTVGANKASNSAVGIGSQINFSNDFGVKIIYSQQQFENSATGGGQVKSDVIKLGTVYSF